MTKKQIREVAKEMKINKLYKRVLNDQLDKLNDMSADEYMQSLNNFEYNCQAGCVSMLIYYSDTEKFYNRYADFIEELASEFDYSADKKELGLAGYKNIMSWFAYECIVSQFHDKLTEL